MHDTLISLFDCWSVATGQTKRFFERLADDLDDVYASFQVVRSNFKPWDSKEFSSWKIRGQAPDDDPLPRVDFIRPADWKLCDGKDDESRL